MFFGFDFPLLISFMQSFSEVEQLISFRSRNRIKRVNVAYFLFSLKLRLMKEMDDVEPAVGADFVGKDGRFL
jgi:hypothetical protein